MYLAEHRPKMTKEFKEAGQLWSLEYVKRILQRLVSRDFEFNWDFSILDKNDGVHDTEIRKKNLAYHVLMTVSGLRQ